VQVCKKAADELSQRGVDAEVIDLRSLHPYDWAAISSSIRKTGRAVFVNEDTEITNFGEHLIRRSVEELWDVLRTPPILEAGKHVPGVGLADNLENASVPGLASVTSAIERAMSGPARPGLFPKKSRMAIDFTLTHETPGSISRAYRHR
jgi:2-oxoisovalerate dehydrogenase E1 component beta subunit